MSYFSVAKGDRGIVHVDGVEVDRVLWCGTDTGIVCKAVKPIQLDNDGNLVTEMIYGKVEVFKL